MPLAIKAVSILTPAHARGLGPVPLDAVGVVVADNISSAAREALTEQGWGYLDRRGHLALRAPGLVVDADIPSQSAPTSGRRDPFDAGATITLACALLLSPTEPPSLRDVARRSGYNVSSISRAAASLRTESLIEADGRPLVTELFWAVSGGWHPTWTAVSHLPDPADAVAAGATGAMAWGAAVVVTADYPPELYLPDAVSFRRATALDPPDDPLRAAAFVAVPPTALASREPSARSVAGYPLAQPLFTALDLAADPARGAELLEDFNPAGALRVW